MDCTTSYLPYETTGYFSKIVTDYLHQSDLLKSFYEFAPTLDGVKKAIAARKNIYTDKALLVKTLKIQYEGLAISQKVNANIELLLQENVYTVTTAHQPNIFTGPLYFIYKIMHAVKLAEELANSIPEAKFVPIYYMGSEDADINELGFINVGTEKLQWETKQTGAVGRMKVDKRFIQIINLIEGQIGVLPFGNSLVQLFKSCYTEGKTIQQATLELVNHLFADYGVVIVIPDCVALKASFIPIFEKELKEQFSHSIVKKTANELSVNYKVQAAGRPLNLFYLINDRRERIELLNSEYHIQALDLVFSEAEILIELNNNPERFSPNVILRGLFQETIMPNIAFIGGGGELAYWMELKNVFNATSIPYPVLILRNSFLFINKEQQAKLNKLLIKKENLFFKTQQLIDDKIKAISQNQTDLAKEIDETIALYNRVELLVDKIDVSLVGHIQSLKTKAIKRLLGVEKKMLRAEKEKFTSISNQITQLKLSLFPNESLQERHDNLSIFYSKYGNEWLSAIYQSSQGLNQQFGIISVD